MLKVFTLDNIKKQVLKELNCSTDVEITNTQNYLIITIIGMLDYQLIDEYFIINMKEFGKMNNKHKNMKNPKDTNIEFTDLNLKLIDAILYLCRIFGTNIKINKLKTNKLFNLDIDLDEIYGDNNTMDRTILITKINEKIMLK